MSQNTQISSGGLSDIIPDIDKFIEEHQIGDDVGQMLKETELTVTYEEDEDVKPALPESHRIANYTPPPSHHEHEMTYPPDQPTDLCNEEYPGPLNFEVYIIPNEQKTPWEYLAKLKKIFISTDTKFPVAFSVRSRPLNLNLFIRATPVFTQAQFFQEVVQRCIAHQHPRDPSNKGFAPHIFRHIMRCGNEETSYFGGEGERSRLNLVLPLGTPQTGSDLVREFFYFVCQNSCPSGMNRRPIEIIFTLEDENGEVLGRRVLPVRICKCPKRDKEKEELALEKSKNQPQQQSSSRGKKRKLRESDDDGSFVDNKVFSLKDVNIVGKKNLLFVYKTCRGLMADEILKLEGKNGADAPFRKCFNELNTLINRLSGE